MSHRNVGEFQLDAGCKLKNSPILSFWKDNTPFQNGQLKDSGTSKECLTVSTAEIKH